MVERGLTPVKWSGLVKDSRTLLRGTGHDVQWVAVQLGRRNRKILKLILIVLPQSKNHVSDYLLE